VSADEQPDWAQGLKDALAEFGKAIETSGHIMAAQGAMGWMMRGEWAKARVALSDLPDERLREVSVTAAALSSLADEMAAGRATYTDE
jgi:hypothetical protein